MTETNESNQNLADSYVFVGSVYLLSNFPAFEKKKSPKSDRIIREKAKSLVAYTGFVSQCTFSSDCDGSRVRDWRELRICGSPVKSRLTKFT